MSRSIPNFRVTARERLHAFVTGRGMVGPLRKVLRGLVPNRRKASESASWRREHLLFLCTYNYEHFRVAYFKAPPEQSNTAPLAAFAWGPNIPSRTACEFNLPALTWPESTTDTTTWVSQWASAFDVEKVTKEFYKDYAAAFGDVERLIGDACRFDTAEDLRMFTQTLFNRLMFLRFIERKGWLDFHGNHEYLRALSDAGGLSGKSLYQSRIRPLFFEALAVEGNQVSEAVGDVPFLNGGLFEENDLDRRAKDVPDNALSPMIGPTGLFYRYNFTIEESTPLDIEVAVDPEMLGKVFEELVTGRHESGSYYTPRPVVSFMCREALKGYLNDKTSASTDAVARLVDDHIVEGLRETPAREILDALDDLKAVDPACGSGAYLLGLMHELVAIYRSLYSERLVRDPRSLYDLKLRIISQNLYGVDIDGFATNIAMLRLWLSLAVEADSPVALPNLDFKIETGDSLLAPDPQRVESLFRDRLRTEADALVSLKREFFDAHGEVKEDYRQKIKQIEDQLASDLRDEVGENVVDWRIHFAEAFAHGRDGFDIAIANPPYVRQELITSLKPALKMQFPDVYAGTADLYVYFYARGVQLLRDGGYLSFIAPNKFFRATYGDKLRTFLLRKTELSSLIDFADYPIFQAITYPAIVVTKKCSAARDKVEVRAHNWDHTDGLERLGRVMAEVARSIPQSELAGDAWRIIDSAAAMVMSKLHDGGRPIGEVVDGRFYRGVVTGKNNVFEIDEDTYQGLIKADRKCKAIIRPWLRGRNVGRWKVSWDEKYLIFTRRGIRINDYPEVKKYLSRYRELLDPRPRDTPANGWKGRKPGSYKWYEIQDAIDYWEEFEKPKIIYQVIATYQQFAYTADPFVSNDKTWIIPDPPAGLLAYLNSKVAWFFLDQVAPKLQGGAFELRSPAMIQVPVPRLSNALIALEEKAIAAASQSHGDGALPELEQAIDDEVVQLFNLSKQDVCVIDGAVEAAGNRFPRKFRESEAYQNYVAEMFGDD